MTELTDEAVKALLEDAGRGYPRLYAEPNPCDLLHEALRALLAARAELVSVLQREAETHRRHDDKFAKMEADLAQARADVKTAVADIVRSVWGRCEALEDEAADKLAQLEKLTDHEMGFWRGQKTVAKSIRRSTEMPTAEAIAIRREEGGKA